MALQESPYWWTALPKAASLPDRPLSDRADVVVVGAGYTGLSAALRLARSGVSAVVLEKEDIGFGASSRNGGQVLTGLKVGPRTLLRRFGRERARELYGASLSAIRFLEGIIASENIDCEYSRKGHLEAAYKPAHFERFKRDQQLLAEEFDHHVRLIPRQDQRSELGSDFYHGLLLDEGSGELHPARYVFGLARAAARAGADLRERTPALGVLREGTGFRVSTPRGSIVAREVFVATNGYTDQGFPDLRRRVIPVGSYIVATERLPDAVAADLLPRRRPVFDSKNFLYYFRLSADNRLLFGGRAQWTPSTPGSTRTSMAILRRALAEVFPERADLNVEWAWSGNVCFTRDLLPRAGVLNGLHYAMGYGGHGVAMATYLGDLMADVILGGSSRNPFRDLPFPRIPLYDGRPWFLPLVGAWYKVQDWMR